MERTYIHYGSDIFSPEKLKEVASRDWDNGLFKPNGLWASAEGVELSWKQWCEDEEFHTDRLDKHFNFTLSDNARILKVKSDKDAKPYIRKWSMFMIDVLDQEKLTENFDGMELCLSGNYENLRYGRFYTWDCDSICIWNPDVIKPVKKHAGD